MSTLAVRFDQELSVAHAINGPLPCPRGVLVAETDPWDTTSRHGTFWNVMPCALDYGHDGDCSTWESGKPYPAKTTVCGLSVDHLPFVPAPDGMKPYAGCFDGNDEFVVDEALFA